MSQYLQQAHGLRDGETPFTYHFSCLPSSHTGALPTPFTVEGHSFFETLKRVYKVVASGGLGGADVLLSRIVLLMINVMATVRYEFSL